MTFARAIRALFGLAFLAASAWAGPNHGLSVRQANEQATQFLRQFKKVRVGITHAPGNGHQAYAVTVIKRVRELGFTGEIEVYYNSEVEKRLVFLLPGFSEGAKGPQNLPGNIKAIRWPEDNLLQDISVLGLMGGDDRGIRASQLGVKTLVKVQPSGWSPGTVEIYGRGVFGLEVSGGLPTHVSAERPAIPGEFLEAQMGHSLAHKKKIPGIQALMENWQRFETMAAYGLSFQEGPLKLANLIFAMKAARLRNPDAFRGPLVIPMVSSFNDAEWKEFHNALRKFPTYEKGVQVINSSDQRIVTSLLALGPSEVLVMPIGSVPQDVWNYLFANSSLPPVVSGTTGSNFAKGRGKPYFSATGNNPFLMDNPVYEKVDITYSELRQTTAPNADGEPKVGALVDFILDSKDPSSDLSEAFALYTDATDRVPDKVSMSLIEAKSHLDNNPLKKPATPQIDSESGVRAADWIYEKNRALSKAANSTERYELLFGTLKDAADPVHLMNRADLLALLELVDQEIGSLQPHQVESLVKRTGLIPTLATEVKLGVYAIAHENPNGRTLAKQYVLNTLKAYDVKTTQPLREKDARVISNILQEELESPHSSLGFGQSARVRAAQGLNSFMAGDYEAFLQVTPWSEYEVKILTWVNLLADAVPADKAVAMREGLIQGAVQMLLDPKQKISGVVGLLERRKILDPRILKSSIDRVHTYGRGRISFYDETSDFNSNITVIESYGTLEREDLLALLRPDRGSKEPINVAIGKLRLITRQNPTDPLVQRRFAAYLLHPDEEVRTIALRGVLKFEVNDLDTQEWIRKMFHDPSMATWIQRNASSFSRNDYDLPNYLSGLVGKPSPSAAWMPDEEYPDVRSSQRCISSALNNVVKAMIRHSRWALPTAAGAYGAYKGVEAFIEWITREPALEDRPGASSDGG